MALPAGLDPDLLRTFVYIAEEGSFTRAGQRVGRTQSAVSMQLQRLETLLGKTLVSRGRGGAIHLTPHGEFLRERSRELLALNDQIWASFRAPAVYGTVRLGTPDDYALRYLPTILKRFAETHPSVQVDVTCLPSHDLIVKLREGELDLTLCSEGTEPAEWPAAALWRAPLSWITSIRHAPHRQDPLPLALGRPSCGWRRSATAALEERGRRFRVAYVSWNSTAVGAAVAAGLAVSVLPESAVKSGMRVLGARDGFPPLPACKIGLLRASGERNELADVLAAQIRSSLDNLGVERASSDAGAL